MKAKNTRGGSEHLARDALRGVGQNLRKGSQTECGRSARKALAARTGSQSLLAIARNCQKIRDMVQLAMEMKIIAQYHARNCPGVSIPVSLCTDPQRLKTSAGNPLLMVARKAGTGHIITRRVSQKRLIRDKFEDAQDIVVHPVAAEKSANAASSIKALRKKGAENYA